jgi:hypothetical protein
MTTNEKTFDALKFKEQVQAEMYERLKDMTPEEQIAELEKGVLEGPFAELYKRLKAKNAEKKTG